MDEKVISRMLKRYDVHRAAPAIKVLKLLYPDCRAVLFRGLGEIEIVCPTEDRMYEVWGGQPFYGRWINVERLSFATEDGRDRLSIPTEELSFEVEQYFPRR